jgi:hypothetical protein
MATKTFDDFKKSADYPVANPFRWQTEAAKAKLAYEIVEQEMLRELKAIGGPETHAIEMSGIMGMFAQILDELRRIGTTVEALALQGDLVEQVAVRMKALRPLIYRGAYKPGEKYVRGNFISYGGSLWHCNSPTDERPGGGGEAWTLAVKRGRDGKDSRQ